MSEQIAAAIEDLLLTGGIMSNVMFNLNQRSVVPSERDRKMFGELQERWDRQVKVLRLVQESESDA